MKTDRVQIAYDLSFTTLFHCGTGIRAGLIDRTVVRDGDSYLYVPGSTFKGVLRERCEQLARMYTQEKQRIASPHDAEAALLGLGQRPPTLVTRIFGSQNTPGRLYFDDARQNDDDKKQYDGTAENDAGKYKGMQVDLYTQVRLDRSTRTAVPGALYTSEFGASDIVFRGNILGWLTCTAIDTAEQSPTYALLLLLAGLHMIDRLGGNKSAGKGHCICTITSVALNGQDIPGDTWRSWLEQLDRLAEYDSLEKGENV
ncbi:MAG TPA: RAMP superfamily CRISPR-associated protein [Ktedonobacteraceae bacterium]|nr:RAMP superfamily CRISPR-associated protein [Ktedonobacteraceae bacterium]